MALACLALVAGDLWGGDEVSRPVVAASRVERRELSRRATFSAELRPYQEIELHARVTGYLDALKVDAGDMVREDQLIATLDVPELKSDVEHALAAERRCKAEIEHARAAYEEAHLAHARLAAVDKAQPTLIAQQDIDAAKAKDRAAEAALAAAQEQARVAEADVKKLRVMETYTRITAPFSGAITKRYSDPGALIQAGTSTGSMPLVRLSQIDRLRCVFPVSVSHVARLKVGDPVEIHIDSTLDRTIRGKVARFSRKVETSTRTMDAEVDVANADFTLTPGMYATVALQVDVRHGVLAVPVQSVARDRNGEATLMVIGPGGRIEERKVRLGLETSSHAEILEGAGENESVVLGSRSALRVGDVVEPRMVEGPPAGGEGGVQATTAR